MSYPTADLCDAFSDELSVAEPIFRNFGKRLAFGGPVVTLKLFEDNSLVRKTLESPGEGRVLVVDGGGSLRCALVGDRLAQLGVENGWAGILVNGCIRDSAVIDTMEIGVKAINTCPLKSIKRGLGDKDVSVHFAGVVITAESYVYADTDGVVVASRPLELSS